MLKSRIAMSNESVLARARASSAFAASRRTQSGWMALSALATAMRASLLSSTTNIRYFMPSHFRPDQPFPYHSTPRHQTCDGSMSAQRRCAVNFLQPLSAGVVTSARVATEDFVQIEHDQHSAVAEKGGAVDSRHAGQKSLRRLQHDIQPLAQAIDLKATPFDRQRPRSARSRRPPTRRARGRAPAPGR